MEQYYYPRTLKGVIISLMDVFNDMHVLKYDSAGTSAQDIHVPFMFGPVEKDYQDRTEGHYYDNDNNEHGNRFYMMMPRMSLTLDSITYNPDRAYGKNEWRYWLAETFDINNPDEVFADYQPTPYDLGFTLHIRTDSLDYFAQLMENILPYFNPKLFLRVKEFSFLDIDRDLPVEITSVTPEFVDQVAENERREVNGTIGMKVEMFFYRPWTYAKVIHVINTRYWIGPSGNFDTSAISIADSFGTSGVGITSAGEPYNLSAVPEREDILTSGSNVTNAKQYNWYQGVLSAAGQVE